MTESYAIIFAVMLVMASLDFIPDESFMALACLGILFILLELERSRDERG